VSDAHKALIGAISNELEDSGLEITSSNREITITDPRLPEKMSSCMYGDPESAAPGAAEPPG
jgi:effector-binding domain-containing protein